MPNVINLGSLGNRGFRMEGVGAEDRAGISVSSAGDFNADGMLELIVLDTTHPVTIERATRHLELPRPRAFVGDHAERLARVIEIRDDIRARITRWLKETRSAATR